MKKILIVAAIEAELAPFLTRTSAAAGQWCTVGAHRVWVGFTGVGPVCAAFHIQRLIGELSPDLVVQAGIAGCYADSGLAVGDTVQVTKERLADLGILVDNVFSDEFSTNEAIDNPSRFSESAYPGAAGFTVSLGCSPLIDTLRAAFPDDRAAVESMEGYSLFYVCEQLNVPFLELRTVSNVVSPDRGSWDISLAVENLSAALLEALRKTLI